MRFRNDCLRCALLRRPIFQNPDHVDTHVRSTSSGADERQRACNQPFRSRVNQTRTQQSPLPRDRCSPPPPCVTKDQQPSMDTLVEPSLLIPRWASRTHKRAGALPSQLISTTCNQGRRLFRKVRSSIWSLGEPSVVQQVRYWTLSRDR